jgi:hypothetical protein
MNDIYHQNYAQKILKMDGFPAKTLIHDNLKHKLRFLKSMHKTFHKYFLKKTNLEENLTFSKKNECLL